MSVGVPLMTNVTVKQTAARKGNSVTWTLNVFNHANDLSSMRDVTFKLHPTFNPPVVIVPVEQNQVASISRQGWGTFDVTVVCSFVDGADMTFVWPLNFEQTCVIAYPHLVPVTPLNRFTLSIEAASLDDIRVKHNMHPGAMPSLSWRVCERGDRPSRSPTPGGLLAANQQFSVDAFDSARKGLFLAMAVQPFHWAPTVTLSSIEVDLSEMPKTINIHIPLPSLSDIDEKCAEIEHAQHHVEYCSWPTEVPHSFLSKVFGRSGEVGEFKPKYLKKGRKRTEDDAAATELIMNELQNGNVRKAWLYFYVSVRRGRLASTPLIQSKLLWASVSHLHPHLREWNPDFVVPNLSLNSFIQNGQLFHEHFLRQLLEEVSHAASECPIADFNKKGIYLESLGFRPLFDAVCHNVLQRIVCEGHPMVSGVSVKTSYVIRYKQGLDRHHQAHVDGDNDLTLNTALKVGGGGSLLLWPPHLRSVSLAHEADALKGNSKCEEEGGPREIQHRLYKTIVHSGNQLHAARPCESERVQLIMWLQCDFSFPKFSLLPSGVLQLIVTMLSDVKDLIALSKCSTAMHTMCQTVFRQGASQYQNLADAVSRGEMSWSKAWSQAAQRRSNERVLIAQLEESGRDELLHLSSDVADISALALDISAMVESRSCMISSIDDIQTRQAMPMMQVRQAMPVRQAMQVRQAMPMRQAMPPPLPYPVMTRKKAPPSLSTVFGVRQDAPVRCFIQ